MTNSLPINNNNIPNLNDIFNLTHTLSEMRTSCNLNRMEIVFHVEKDELKLINEDIFYRNNPDGKNKPEDTDEIIVNVNGFKIRYVTNLE